MTSRLSATALLLAALAACAPVEAELKIDRQALRVRIAPEFSMYERAQILRAANEWNAHGANLQIVEADAHVSVGPATQPLKNNVLGVTILGRVVLLDMRRIELTAELCGVAKHEFGHVLGLEHTHGGIMHPFNGPQMRCGL